MLVIETTWEFKAGRLQVHVQPGELSKTLSQKIRCTGRAPLGSISGSSRKDGKMDGRKEGTKKGRKSGRQKTKLNFL